VRLLLALGALLLAGDALAHATQLSSARLQVAGNTVTAVLELNGRDLEVALRTTLLDPAGQVSGAQLRAARGALDAYVLGRARVLHGGASACRGSVGGARGENDHVLVEVAWRCAPVAGALIYESTLFHEVDPAARHVVTASGDVRRMGLLSVATARLTLAQTRTDVLEVLRHYFAAGVEHIALGYDHIAFLLAVIAWARRPWPLIGVITAFTLAHSVTLTLAVLDLVTLPPDLVELLVVLSVVYVAAENFFVRDLRRRWLLTFAFGLVHGFGFASVLRDYGLPDDVLVPALAAFNVGVEAGQLAVVAVAFGALHGLLRTLSIRGRERVQAVAPLGVSGVVLLLGLYWTAGRIMLLY
jgi:hypothetical protein